jgi:hypothetical protein
VLFARIACVRALAFVVVVCGISSPAVASSPALAIELVDSEPVGVWVSAPVPPQTCATAPILFKGAITKGKPLLVSSDAINFCVAQTEAPFTNIGFGSWLAVQHLPGMTPVRIALRSRRAFANAPPQPVLYASPLGVGVIGEGRIGVRIAFGPATPCNAAGNTILFEGTLDANTPRIIDTQASCVCVEQTFAPFVNTGWTNARPYCRSLRCAAKICINDPVAPFVISLVTRAPG